MKQLFLFLFILTGVNSVILSQTINIPAEHGTLGTLDPLIVVDPEVDEDFWTIINESNCDLDFVLWVTINNTTFNLGVVNVPANSNVTIPTSQIFSFLSPPYNSETVTNFSFNILQQGGSTQIGVGYPGTNSRVSNPNIEGGCNCVHVNCNQSTRTIIISDC